MMNDQFLATIEARMTSSRLPGKVMKKINGKYILEILVSRIKESQFINNILIATTTNKEDDSIVSLAENLNIDYYRGSEDDVLGRLSDAISSYHVDSIIQLTGDNPLIDPRVIDFVANEYINNNYDFVTNNGLMNLNNHFLPLGMDVSIFKKNELININKLTRDKENREHPTLYFYREGKNKYKIKNVEFPKSWINNMNVRLTLDTPEDFIVIEKICRNFKENINKFSLIDIYNFLRINPKIPKINSQINHKIPSNLNN